jgi:hypothetical protein
MKSKVVTLTLMLMFSITSFSQLKGMSGFEVFDDGSFSTTVKTEQEAIARYRSVIDANGVDTTSMVIHWGNNPLIFDSFSSETKGMVNIGVIVKFEGKYDILFIPIKKKKNHLFDVIDNEGNIVELIYE